MIDSAELADASTRPSDTARLVERLVSELSLSMTDITVATEAATGPFAWTAAIAACAGASAVIAVGRDSAWATAEGAFAETRAAAEHLGAERVVQFTRNRDDAAKADVITNLGPLRPIDAAFVSRLRAGTAIPLMWETWEHRESELDLAACVSNDVLVLGTNESHPAASTMDYVGLLAVKLCREAGVELVGQRIALVASGRFGSAIGHALARCGAEVGIIGAGVDVPLGARFAGGSLASEGVVAFLAGAKAIVIAEHQRSDELIGDDGDLTADSLLAACGAPIPIVHISGLVDARSLAAAGFPLMPGRIATAPRTMSVTTAYLGPEPVVRLHAVGLKVGEICARAWRKTGSMREARRLALVDPVAQDFSVAQWAAAGFVER